MHEDDASRVSANEYEKDIVHKTYSKAASLGSNKASARPRFADIASNLEDLERWHKENQPKSMGLRFYT